MKNVDQSWRYTVLGMTQSGKSYLIKKIFLTKKAFIVYDIKHEFAKFGVVVSTPLDFVKALKKGHKRIIYQPIKISDLEEFDKICEIIYNGLKNIIFVVDEAHKVCPKSKITENFENILTMGQGKPRCIGVVCATQRGQLLNETALTQSRMWILFQLSKGDGDYLTRKIDVTSKELKNIPPRHFLVYKNWATTPKIKHYKPI